MKKVTIKDVAKDAGVSVGTVSKVINNKGYVGKETLVKVMASIDRLGYSVNANARSLKSSKSNKVAVLISDISNFYLMSIAKEMEKTIRALGYHMILLSHNDDEQLELASLQIILEQQVDALVIIPTGGNGEMIGSIKRKGIPVISIDRKVDDVVTDLIMDDHYYGSFETIKYLHLLGHRRIGVIYGHRQNSIGRERYQGAIDAIKQLNMDEDSTLIKEANFKEEQAYRSTMELLLSPKPPTAIYSCNNTMTKGVLKAVREQGLRVAEDVSIIAFGDRAQWELITPALSLMAQPVKRIGIEASILLKNRLEAHEEFAEKQIIIKPELVPGNSCQTITIRS
jgi:LacI family transcriptional regulator